MHSGLILCVRLVWLKRIPTTQTNSKAIVNAPINDDSNNTVSIIPHDANLIDDKYVYCNTYEEAKEFLNRAIRGDTDVTQDLPDSYIVSQNEGSFWFKLTQDINEPTKFIIYAYASKDELAKKYIRRMLEDCIDRMDYMINPEDYNFEEAEENYENYYSNKALCVTCGEINYAEPVCEVEGRLRMVCCDCIEIVNQCDECHNLTLDYLYESDYDEICRDLCFDCKFNKSVKEQMPLEVHLSIRRDIQSLSNKHFNIIADYADLCELNIFDAYRYKSRCHFYDCDRMVLPNDWYSEEVIQFCCRRHCDLADIVGCHCQNTYDGRAYDEDYAKATCKVCISSNHEKNMIPRIALRESDKDVKPIVSAICIFNEGIFMSNVLAESLVDLHEYFI